MEEQHELSRMCDDGCPNPPAHTDAPGETMRFCNKCGYCGPNQVHERCRYHAYVVKRSSEVQIERKHFTAAEICRIFRVPRELLSDTESNRCGSPWRGE